MTTGIPIEALDHWTTPFLATSPDGQLVYANTSLCQLLGLTVKRAARNGESGEHVAVAVERGLRHVLEDLSSLEAPTVHCSSLCAVDGRVIGVQWFSRPVCSVAGSVTHFESIGIDLSTRCRSLAPAPCDGVRACDVLLPLTAALDHVADHIAIMDLDGRIEFVNIAFEQVSGRTRNQIVGRHIREVWGDLLDPESAALIRKTLAEGGTFQSERVNRNASGELFFDEVSFSAVRDEGGSISRCIAVGRDATARHLTDPLTGLHTRRMLVERIRVALAHRRREPERHCALLFLDVDHFKAINDTYGKDAGDRIILDLAHRIQSAVREVDAVAQVGHLNRDEFSVLLEGLREVADAKRVAERVQERVREPISMPNGDLVISMSVGIALGDTTYTSPDDVIRDAETAMMQAKRGIGDKCRFFDPALHEAIVRRLELASELRHAIENEELLVYHQPVVSLVSGAITGVEALVRWQHPRRGFLPPLEFISTAEENGLIMALGTWVLRAACRQVKEWHDVGYADLSLSVNVSARQFRDSSFVESVMSIVNETRIEPRTLKLEVTESTAADDPESVVRTLSELQSRGIQILLDDFGTGYSSLNFLTRFPLDKLKIDRSFVNNVPGSRHDEAVTTTIVAMAKSLGVGLIAEGVETWEQLEFLRRLDCEEMQGYLFSKPVRASELEALLRSGKRLSFPAIDGRAQC